MGKKNLFIFRVIIKWVYNPYILLLEYGYVLYIYINKVNICKP